VLLCLQVGESGCLTTSWYWKECALFGVFLENASSFSHSTHFWVSWYIFFKPQLVRFILPKPNLVTKFKELGKGTKKRNTSMEILYKFVLRPYRSSLMMATCIIVSQKSW
jgi:hypothetical protein